MGDRTLDDVVSSRRWMEDRELRKWFRDGEDSKRGPPPYGTPEHRSIDKSISADLGSLNALYRQIREIEERIVQKTVLKSPVPLLPSNILGRIFGISDPMTYPANSKDLLRIAAVCRQWRQAAFSTPSLWSYILVGGRTRAEALQPKFSSHRRLPEEQTLEAWLAHAEGAPLTIYIRDDIPITDAVSQLLFKHIDRIGCIVDDRENNRNEDLIFYEQLIVRSPNLTRLEHMDYKCDGVKERRKLALAPTAKFTSAEIRGHFFEVVSPSLKDLEVVMCEENIAHKDLLDNIQESYPNVTRLDINCWAPNLTWAKRPAPDRSYDFLSLQFLSCERSTTIPRVIMKGKNVITHLEVSLAILQEDIPVLPLLQFLKLRGWGTDDKEDGDEAEAFTMDTAHTAFSRFPALKYLYIYIDPRGDRDINVLGGLLNFDDPQIPLCTRLSFVRVACRSWEWLERFINNTLPSPTKSAPLGRRVGPLVRMDGIRNTDGADWDQWEGDQWEDDDDSSAECTYRHLHWMQFVSLLSALAKYNASEEGQRDAFRRSLYNACYARAANALGLPSRR